MTELATTEQKPKPQIATGGALAGIAPQSIEEVFRLSQALSRAGDMVPKDFKGKPDEIMAAVLRGAEVGLMPMQALSNIAVINGRASLWGDALPALIQRAGHHIDVRIEGEGENMVATATLERSNGKTVTRTFSVEDAKAARLWGKQGPWTQYPKRMLMHRARAWAVRDGAADALMGLQVAEEMEDAPPIKDVTPKSDGPNLHQRLQQIQQAQEADGNAPDAPQEAPEEPEAHVVDVEHPAYQEGHAAAPDYPCPYEADDDIRANWLAGQKDAREEAGA